MLTIRKGSNATKSNVESLLFSPIVIVVHTPMDILINAIVVAPQFWLLFINNSCNTPGAKELRSVLSSEGLDQSSNRMKSLSVGHPLERLDPGRQDTT